VADNSNAPDNSSLAISLAIPLRPPANFGDPVRLAILPLVRNRSPPAPWLAPNLLPRITFAGSSGRAQSDLGVVGPNTPQMRSPEDALSDSAAAQGTTRDDDLRPSPSLCPPQTPLMLASAASSTRWSSCATSRSCALAAAALQASRVLPCGCRGHGDGGGAVEAVAV
jgi:hypothetical protein